MNNQSIPLILVVENHWLLGKLRTSDLRVLDILNDPQTDYLDLHDVKVFSSGDQQNCLADLPEAIVPKERLQLLIIPTDKYEKSRKERMHRIVDKKSLDVSTVAAGYFIQGKLHVRSHGYDSRYTLTHVLGHFFPITDATISRPGVEPITVSTVIANKTYLSCLSCNAPDETAAMQSAGLVSALFDIGEESAP